MHEAAQRTDLDPDELSFVHTLRVVERKMSNHPTGNRPATRPGRAMATFGVSTK